MNKMGSRAQRAPASGAKPSYRALIETVFPGVYPLEYDSDADHGGLGPVGLEWAGKPPMPTYSPRTGGKDAG